MQTPNPPTGPTGQQIGVVVDRVADDVITLHVTGEIDLLTEVTFLGSAGLAEIVSASQTGADQGAKLLLVATNRAVLRPLEVTGLLSLFTVYDTVDAALADAGE